MELPVQRAVFLNLPINKSIDIIFKNIVYSPSKNEKKILDNVSGTFKSGELTAIMGPSGAGKTSLLNILTGYQKDGIQGTVTTNCCQEENLGAIQYRKESCYILQNDQLTPYFTVNEIMNIAANLKLGQSLSDKSKEILIYDILDTIGLSNCNDTRCSKLSGGQRKRLSIALELIDNPPIMFLDEPTTGLDSSSSLQCISMLKSLANGGRTIICTIHQPSATIYETFDHIYTMAQGKCVYQGSSKNTVAYLAESGFICPKYHNPADFLLEVTNCEYGNFTTKLAEAAKRSEKWRNSFVPLAALIEEEKNLNNNQTGKLENNFKAAILVNSPSEWSKFIVLLNRTFLHLYRDWTVTHLKFALHTLIGIFIGLFFLDIGNDASKLISNFGYMLVTCVYLSYTSMMPAVLKFPSELAVLRKERFNNWYNLKTYYAAFMVADIPMQMIFSTSYTAISYYMSAQPSEWSRFAMFLVICMLVTIAAESGGIFLGTLVNPINGTFLGAISLAFMIAFAGFLVFLNHMNVVFYAISFTSYLRYGMEGLVYAVYNQRGCLDCPEEVDYCPYQDPQTIIDEIGMTKISFESSVLFFIGLIIVIRTVTYFTLKWSLSRNVK